MLYRGAGGPLTYLLLLLHGLAPVEAVAVDAAGTGTRSSGCRSCRCCPLAALAAPALLITCQGAALLLGVRGADGVDGVDGWRAAGGLCRSTDRRSRWNKQRPQGVIT